jgi:hypothetical protein
LRATFRHQAKIATARIGDFDRSQLPFLSRVVSAVIRDAAEQATRRQEPEPQAWSYEAERRDIVSRYSLAVIEARRSNKPRHEIEAIIRALRYQQALELAAMRRRRKDEAASRRARQARPKGVD